MAASVQLRPQNRDLGMVMREVDENLAIFLGIRNGEKERNDHLLVEDSDEFGDSKGADTKPDSLLTSNASRPEFAAIAVDDNLFNLEVERSDFDWFVTQPHASLLPSEDVGLQDSAASQTEILNDEGVSPKSELANTCEESGSLGNISLHPATSASVDSSAAANGRTLPSGNRKSTPRAATPTRRPALPAKSKPSRASTPTSRATLPSSKPTAAQARSSTPARATKSAPRPATPTRKPATLLNTSGVSASDRSSSGRKTGPTTLKNPVPSRGTSPTVKSRPSMPSEMLSISHDASHNPKISVPKRPASASRGRPSAPATHLSSSSNGKPRQKSCSPARVRAPSGSADKTGSKMLSRSRGYSNGGDDVNPVLMGTQMVERVVNMRKLAPPKQDEYVSHDNPRKCSQENLGFGRSLSKKSLDMAIRHMDIRRRIPDNLRSVANGVQSGSAKSTTTGVSESPLTSSCDSS